MATVQQTPRVLLVMKKPKITTGDIVQIVFYDHCENFHDAMKFEVIGKVTAITKKAYQIHTWMYHDQIQRAQDRNADDNENCFAIVKSAIESIRKLK